MMVWYGDIVKSKCCVRVRVRDILILMMFQLLLFVFFMRRDLRIDVWKKHEHQDCILIKVFISKDTARYYEKCSDKERYNGPASIGRVSLRVTRRKM